MQIHRSAHERAFTVLPNGLLQNRGLSYTARGLLADLLSRPDGWREDGRQMADSSPQGRAAIRRAIKELTQEGHYRVVVVRLPDGTLRSEVHVYDVPWGGRGGWGAVPGVEPPEAGGGSAGPRVAPEVKDREKEPTLPADPSDLPDRPELPDLPEPPDPPDEGLRGAVAALYRAIRPEPRLRIGEAEAAALAPLVARWLERGATGDDLARALLPGLPDFVRSPASLLRSRLERKLPPLKAPPVAEPARPRPVLLECPECRDPVPRPGLCRPCAGVAARPAPAVGGGAPFAAAGAARARAALLGLGRAPAPAF
ncbi:hypothetical protein ACWGB8_19580 [Kitasatospora sp. NPDC054939]